MTTQGQSKEKKIATRLRRRFKKKAEFLRISTGSTDRTTTLLKAIDILSISRIPHLVFGGYAVQERGYPRFTVDVDLIVPDVMEARDILVQNGFRKNRRFKTTPSPKLTVTDRETDVAVDLFPGGRKVVPEAPLPLPMPKTVTKRPKILALPELISSKLSGFVAGGGCMRSHDLADAVELMKSSEPPRNFQVAPEVQKIYSKLWKGLFKDNDEHIDWKDLACLR